MKKLLISNRIIGSGFLLLIFIGAFLLSATTKADSVDNKDLISASSGESYKDSTGHDQYEVDDGSNMNDDQDSDLNDDEDNNGSDDNNDDSDDDDGDENGDGDDD
jgi:hypothetical protein